MVIKSCKDCPDKGCGAYHDICEVYQEAKAKAINKDVEINGYEAHKKYRLKQLKIDRAKSRARRG